MCFLPSKSNSRCPVVPDSCSRVPRLWLKTQRRLAAFRVERDRVVLMGDDPRAVNLAKADRRTPPHINRVAVCSCSVHSVEAKTEGNVTSGMNGQVPNFVADWVLE